MVVGAGRPAKPNRVDYIDTRPIDISLPLYHGVLSRRPRKPNRFDFRRVPLERAQVAVDGYKKLKNPRYHSTTSIGVALLSDANLCDAAATLADARDVAHGQRGHVDRGPPKNPFAPMVNCLGKALAATALTKLTYYERYDRSIGDQRGAGAIRDALGNVFNNGAPLNADDLCALSLEERAQQLLEADIAVALEAKRQKQEEDAKAQRAAKLKEEAETGTQQQAEKETDSDESDKHVDEDVDLKIIQRTLFDHVQNNKHRKVDEMFSQGVDVNLRDQNGNTALHIACQNGAKKMIKTCLKHGAELSSQNRQGQTPIHYCFAYQYDKIAAFLISKGANDLIVNEYGLTCYEGLKPLKFDTETGSGPRYLCL